MISKTLILGVASLISVASAATTNPYANMCNPANCPDMSTSCYKCNKRLDPTCALGEAAGIGVCIEPVPLNQKKSYNQKYTDRCRRATDPNGGNALPAKAYVKACREFEYTCFDGTCETVKGLPNVCKANVVEEGSGKCDPSVDTLFDTIPSLWETKYTDAALAKVCEDHGGVKYNYLRCDSQFVFQSQTGCDASSPFKVDVKGCTSEEPEIVQDTHECTETEVVGSSETCCLVDEEPGTCRSLVEIGASSNEVPANGGSDDLPASGIILELETEESQERCCCTQSCNCFGDPHCDSLFGKYEISRGDGGFNMFEDGDFKVDVEIGAPGGVILNTVITMNGETYEVSAEQCFDTLGDTVTAGSVSIFGNTQPDGWKFKAGSGTAVNPVYHVTDLETHSVVIITCIRFSQNQGPNKGIHERLDVEVLKNVPLESGTDDVLCCPAPEKVYDILHPGLKGFCASTEDSSNLLPDSERRRLGNLDLGDDFTEIENPWKDVPEKEISNEYVKAERTCANIIKGMAKNKKKMLGAGFCTNYDKCVGMEMEFFGGSCSKIAMKLVEEYESLVVEGTESLQSKASRTYQCHTFATDPVFDPDNQEKCARGVEMQVKPQNAGNWKTVYFIPEGVTFCNGHLKILFEYVLVNGEPFDVSKHDLRFVTCSASEECAFACLPEVTVSSLKAKILYPCKTSLAKDEFLQHALSTCSGCGDYKACVEECIGSGKCGCDAYP